MSGTSADAIDAALVEWTHATEPRPFRLVAYREEPHAPELQQRIHALAAGRTPEGTALRELAALDVELASASPSGDRGGARDAGIALTEIDAVASHGRPSRTTRSCARRSRSAPSRIAERTGCTTIADFRTRDLARGRRGRAARALLPLAAFGSADEARLVLNLGGIANVTFLPRGARRGRAGLRRGTRQRADRRRGARGQRRARARGRGRRAREARPRGRGAARAADGRRLPARVAAEEHRARALRLEGSGCALAGCRRAGSRARRSAGDAGRLQRGGGGARLSHAPARRCSGAARAGGRRRRAQRRADGRAAARAAGRNRRALRPLRRALRRSRGDGLRPARQERAAGNSEPPAAVHRRAPRGGAR